MAKKGRYVYDWPRPMVTVDMVVFRLFKGKVNLLLIKRGKEPFKGRWAFPGGFIELDEELEDAAARELTEETGLTTEIELDQMHTFGRCGRDPRGRQISIVFMGIIRAGNDELKAGDDAAEAEWFDIDTLPKEMAFDHNEVADFAIAKLQKERV